MEQSVTTDSWMRHATFQGQDTLRRVLPNRVTVRGDVYRTVRHYLNPSAPAYTVAQIEKILDTVRPGEWSIRMWDEDDPNAPDPVFCLDTAFVGDGKLLALGSAVGGPWGGGISLMRGDVLDLCATGWGCCEPEEKIATAESMVVSRTLKGVYDSVDLISRLLGCC